MQITDEKYKILAVSYFGNHKVLHKDLSRKDAQEIVDNLNKENLDALLDYKMIDDKGYDMFYT